MYSGIRVANSPVAIKHVEKDRISDCGELPNGTRVPMEVVLQKKLSSGFSGVIRLLDGFKRPDGFVLILERPQPVQDLFDFITERGRGGLQEELACSFFGQVLEAVRPGHDCRVLPRDIKGDNVLTDLNLGISSSSPSGRGAAQGHRLHGLRWDPSISSRGDPLPWQVSSCLVSGDPAA